MADLDALRNQMKKRKEMKSSFSSQRINLVVPSTQPSQDVEYHFHRGECYYNGTEGFPVDLDEAFKEYLKAAELGHTKAMKELASDYLISEHSILGYDLDKADYWARKAIEHGDNNGYYILALVLEERNKGKEAVDQLEIGASKGDLDCIERLGIFYYWGSEVAGYAVSEDENRALELLTSVRWDDRHSIAMELLGNLYRNREEYPKAVECFDKALEIDSSNYSAMASLGTLLRSEEEIKDYRRAKELLQEAADNGEREGMNGLGVMFYLGEGCERNERVAIDWIKKAAQEGLYRAMINLYDILVEENRDEALYWLNRAAKEGSEEAKNRLQEMSQENDSSSNDTTRSDKIYDSFLNNLDNTFNLTPSRLLNSGFPNRIEGIQKVIEKGDLSDYEIDRLKILQGWLSLCYFRHHFLDDDFDEQEDDYYKILDRVDDYISSMSEITDEGAYIYYIANMYSADRFKDVDPNDKLKELWGKLSEIKLDEKATEFKVQFWHDFAQDVYGLMSELLTPNNYSSESKNSNEDIKDRVISIVAKTLSIEEDEVHLYSRLEADLGADSLDAVELIMEVEKEFGLTIPDEAAEKIRTIGDIVSYLQRRI